MAMTKRIAIVTGGTGGIGTAICRTLHDNGFIVVAGFNNGGSDDKAQQWQLLQRRENYQFEIMYGDVSNFESCNAMVAAIEEKWGPIDILINNAGITMDASLKKMEPVAWESVIRTNLDSVFNMCKQVVPGMLERKFGRIINISSINGQKGQFGQTNYSAAKAGMHGFTKALALELAGKGITVNTISPGYVATEMVKKMPQEVLEKIISDIPMKRLGNVEEIAHVVAFLVHEHAGYITGANIAINGGQHMF